MKPTDKKRVIAAVAWKIIATYPTGTAPSLRIVRSQVERDFDLLGIREFSEKYAQYIHKET